MPNSNQSKIAKDDPVWRAVLPPGATIQQAIQNLDETALQIVLVVDSEGILLGTVTDGDIRRGLLRGITMDTHIDAIAFRDSLVVPPEFGRETVLQLMHANKIRQLPVTDGGRRLLGLHLMDDLIFPSERPNIMVIMAGGKGVRLRPHTENCPKPLLPVAGKPMLEHIIERAMLDGFGHFVLAIHYLGHMIEDYFGDGSRLNVRIDYLREDEPLGTAGALGLLMPKPHAPFVVTNGDVLTDIRYGDLLDFHVRHNAFATMAVRAYEWQHPYGVVQTRGVDIVGFEEKPVTRTHINAGVYALMPEALNLIPSGERCDMPGLFEKLQASGMRTVAYPMHEPWLDVGRPVDLQRANNDLCGEKKDVT
ncbi:MAG: CBS domain-containing protein [Oxalobacter sp.]|nr:MAG: CBS domain-containing protein [Oxalobacter sp.]